MTERIATTLYIEEHSTEQRSQRELPYGALFDQFLSKRGNSKLKPWLLIENFPDTNHQWHMAKCRFV